MEVLARGRVERAEWSGVLEPRDWEAHSVYFGGDAAGGYKVQCMAM